MKVIENIELLKKLQPYIQNIDTEYFVSNSGVYQNFNGGNRSAKPYEEEYDICKYTKLKTLTTEEAIVLLPDTISGGDLQLSMNKTSCQYVLVGDIISEYVDVFRGETLLEAISEMLDYLITNNIKND